VVRRVRTSLSCNGTAVRVQKEMREQATGSSASLMHE
jgi:hypothetical protein